MRSSYPAGQAVRPYRLARIVPTEHAIREKIFACLWYVWVYSAGQ